MKVGKRELLYVLFMGLAAGLAFVKTMAYGAFLSPKNMGYLAIAITISGYGGFVSLGLLNGLNRELPVCLGMGRKEYYSKLIGEATSTIFLLQLISLAAFYGIVQLFVGGPLMKKAFLLGGFMAVSIPYNQIVMVRLRSEQRILSFSILQFFMSAGTLALGILGIKYFGFQGAVYAAILVNITAFVLVTRTNFNKVNFFYFKKKDILYLMKIGLPLMGATVLASLRLTMDKLFIIKYSSPADLGIYHMGAMPLTLALILSGITCQYVEPRLLFKYGQGGSLREIYRQSVLASLFIIIVLACGWPVVHFCAKFAITNWLPNYEKSLSIISIFYIGTIFTAAKFGVIINAANRQVLSTISAACLVCVAFISYASISFLGLGVKWYAYVNVVIQILDFAMILGICYALTRRERARQKEPEEAVVCEAVLQ